MKKLLLLLIFTIGIKASAQAVEGARFIGLNFNEISKIMKDQCSDLNEFTFNEESGEYTMIFGGGCEGTVTGDKYIFLFNRWGGCFLHQHFMLYPRKTFRLYISDIIDELTKGFEELDSGNYRKSLKYGTAIIGDIDYNEDSDSYRIVYEEYDGQHTWKWANAPIELWKFLEDSGDTQVFKDGKLIKIPAKEPSKIYLHF